MQLHARPCRLLALEFPHDYRGMLLGLRPAKPYENAFELG